jgi:hypothetical protein
LPGGGAKQNKKESKSQEGISSDDGACSFLTKNAIKVVVVGKALNPAILDHNNGSAAS